MCSGAPLVEQAAAVTAAWSTEDRLLKLADLRQAVDAAMVSALVEIDGAPGMVMLDGSVDGGRWLASRSEIHPAEATGLARLASDLPAMPATGEAVEKGRIGCREGASTDGSRRFADPQRKLHNACMTSITIRDVPDDARDELAARAASTGRSLQEYLRAELIGLARRPNAEALVARVRERKRRTASSLASERVIEHRDAGRR